MVNRCERLGGDPGEHPLVGIALEWRTVSKLQSTYVEALPKLVEADGRIHTTFQQAIAATGRLSSVEPNLQNIPIRSELGRKIRHAFIAEKGNRLVAADYSQIELRILAHVTRDPHLIEAFAAGRTFIAPPPRACSASHKKR